MDLVLPVKSLHLAKTRLRGPAQHSAEHARLTLALVLDTLAAARAAAGVRRVLVVTSDPLAATELAAPGVEVVAEGRAAGLNAAYRHGVDVLRRADPTAAVGALQADLPALRPDELSTALDLFAELGATRAFTPDADGSGTTLLLARPGAPLDPAFGVDSATRHAASGAVELQGWWPGLRRDVDTVGDLTDAVALGVGERTAAFTGSLRAGSRHAAARGEQCSSG